MIRQKEFEEKIDGLLKRISKLEDKVDMEVWRRENPPTFHLGEIITDLSGATLLTIVNMNVIKDYNKWTWAIYTVSIDGESHLWEYTAYVPDYGVVKYTNDELKAIMKKVANGEKPDLKINK
jgi:hypothetical protein